MKVNFKKFPCYMGIKKDVRMERDIAESLADVIYGNVPGVAAKALALNKIYPAKGEVELDEREVKIIRDCTALLPGVYADSINDWLDELEKEEQ